VKPNTGAYNGIRVNSSSGQFVKMTNLNLMKDLPEAHSSEQKKARVNYGN
jgi:hypothetical protein